MNPATVDLLQSSFATVALHDEAVVGRFFDRLFEQHPELRSLFPDDLADLRPKVLATITMVMQHLAEPAALKLPLQDLGRRHEDFGAVGEHYPIFRDTFISALSEMIGTAWTADHHEAWSSALDLVSEVMLSGYVGEERRLAA